MIGELSGLEKALSAGDFAKQKAPLTEIVKALKPMRLKSIESLDINTRGRLITTLLRVSRQPKPPPAEPTAPPSEDAASSETAASSGDSEATPETGTEGSPAAAASAASGEVSVAAGEATGSESPPGSGTPDAPTLSPEQADASASPMNGDAAAASGTEGEASAPSAQVAVPAAPPAPPVDEKTAAYQDVMYLIGSVWRAVGEQDRAAPFFELSGRKVVEEREAPAERPSEARGPRRDSAPGGRDSATGRRESREPRDPSRPSREARNAPLTANGDWREEAQALETHKRTRDAARVHEQHKSFADAARLYEVGGDLKSALRNLISAKDTEGARRLLPQLTPIEVQPILEKGNAYELLMELYVAKGDFENVARLYERAKQFDQAALAWERAGKLSNARKAYDRAHDSQGAARMRDREVQKLIERGDRLGAAVLQIAAGLRERAVETLMALPAPKAFRFLQKAKLDAEAQSLAQKEIAQAVEEKQHGNRARWLEMLDDKVGAADAWEQAERKDKALALHEQLQNWPKSAQLAEAVGQLDKAQELFARAGDTANAERVKALPRPVAPPPAAPAPASDEAEHDAGVEAAPPPPAPEKSQGTGSEGNP